MEKGVNKIENQGENYYKMLQMTDFGEWSNYFWIETNISFFRKKVSMRSSWA